MPERKENCWYTGGWSAVMAGVGAQANQTIVMDNDAPFVALRLTGKVLQAGVLVNTWAGTVLLTQAGRSYFGATQLPLPFDEFVTPNSAPYELAPPIIFPRAANLIIQFTSNVVAATQCCLTLHGYKIYPE
jgi:hypothetical protein